MNCFKKRVKLLVFFSVKALGPSTANRKRLGAGARFDYIAVERIPLTTNLAIDDGIGLAAESWGTKHVSAASQQNKNH
ncbi:hypothetical protein [Pediococcus acidilactici]|uniref:hypothetical protein n=1 Tax=Pediococcus acidilactici TaxID=1254 RepID=UPI00190F9B39|nr:hypothetical protein [Pediococcus acidilactici]